MYIIFLFFFFFFKQKTAYEIYQCDWSSDVCSSDLTCDSLRAYTAAIVSGEKNAAKMRGEGFPGVWVHRPVEYNSDTQADLELVRKLKAERYG